MAVPLSPSSQRRVLLEAAVVALYLGLALVATRPLGTDLHRQTLAGPDPISHMWMQHWLTSHILQPDQLFHGNIFHPYSHAVLHTDLSLGTTVLLLPLRPLLDDPVPLFNVGTLLALTFGGWAFQFLVRKLTGNLWAGLLAGILAAFGSHQLSHIYHLNLLSIGWLALFLWALHELLAKPRVGIVLFLGVTFALTALSSGYYAVAACLLALLFAGWHARLFLGRRLAAAGGAVVVAVLIMSPYLHHFLQLRQESSLSRPPGLSARMAFHPTRDLGSRAAVYRPLLGRQGQRLFPGVIALMLAFAAVRRRAPRAGYYLAATFLLIIISLGPFVEIGGLRIPLPYRYLFSLPLLQSMRHPYTFAAVGVFTLAVLAGLGWASTRLGRRPWAGPVIVALAVVETLGARPAVRRVPPGLPPAYEHLEQRPPGPVLELPVASHDALLWAARHGRPVINGIGAFAPPQILRLDHNINRFWLDSAPGDVDDDRPTRILRERFPVRYIILPGRRPKFRRLARAFDRSHTYKLLETFADGARLYEMQRDAQPSKR